MSSGFEEDTTAVAGVWIEKGLQEYTHNTANQDRWKSEDAATSAEEPCDGHLPYCLGGSVSTQVQK